MTKRAQQAESSAAPAESPAESPTESVAAPDAGETRSLVDDLADLMVDARLWLDAELAYQKTRASFVAASLRSALALAAAAAVLGLVALIALTVGVTIALMPIVGTWGATGLVTVVLLLVIALLLRAAARRWADVREAMRENRELEPGDER